MARLTRLTPQENVWWFVGTKWSVQRDVSWSEAVVSLHFVRTASFTYSPKSDFTFLFRILPFYQSITLIDQFSSKHMRRVTTVTPLTASIWPHVQNQNHFQSENDLILVKQRNTSGNEISNRDPPSKL